MPGPTVTENKTYTETSTFISVRLQNPIRTYFLQFALSYSLLHGRKQKRTCLYLQIDTLRLSVAVSNLLESARPRPSRHSLFSPPSRHVHNKTLTCSSLTINSWCQPRRSTRRRLRQQRRSLSTPRVSFPAAKASGVCLLTKIRLVDLFVNYHVHHLHHFVANHDLPGHRQSHSDRMAHLLHFNRHHTHLDGLFHQDDRDAWADQHEGGHADRRCYQGSYKDGS